MTNSNTFIQDGFQLVKWKLTADMIDNVTCLMPDVPKDRVYDCAINALNFVKQIDDPEVARFLAKLKNTDTTTQKGTNVKELLDLLFYSYTTEELKRNDQLLTYDISTATNNWMEDLKDAIGDGYCTLFNIGYAKESGHSLVAGVYNNELVAIDPQQELAGSFNLMMDIFNGSIRHGRVKTIAMVYRIYNRKRILHMAPFSKMKGRPTKPAKRTRVRSSLRSSEQKLIPTIYTPPIKNTKPISSANKTIGASFIHWRRRATKRKRSTNNTFNRKSVKRMRTDKSLL